jgi:excisionase family DNA binding protein
MTTKRLLSAPDVSASLGIGLTKTWELIATGELPTVRIGRRRLVPAAALDEYVRGLEQAEPIQEPVAASVE